MTPHEADRQAAISHLYTVNKTTEAVSVITPETMLHKLVDVSGPEEFSCSTSEETTNSTENVMNVLAAPLFYPRGQHKSKSISNRIGWQGGLSHQFLSLSERQKDAPNGKGPSGSQTDSENAHLLRCRQSNDEENIDFTSLSSFKRREECPIGFVPQAGIGNLYKPRQAFGFTDSYVGGSHLTPGLTLEFMHCSFTCADIVYSVFHIVPCMISSLSLEAYSIFRKICSSCMLKGRSCK
jgi:hypothetical protein